MSRHWILLAPILLVGLPLEMVAQSGERMDECREILVSQIGRDSTQAAAVRRPCRILALDLVNELEPLLFEDEVEVAPRDLQPAQEGSSNAAGSPAESEPVAASQPMAIGGGSVSAVGSDAGSDAITALTFNPGVFFGPNEPSESLATEARLTDLSVFFPVEELDKDEDGDIDYFGLRLRLNFTGLSAGREIWQVAEELQAMVRTSNEVADTLWEDLLDVPRGRLGACVRTLRDVVATGRDVGRACGSDIRPTFRLDREAFRSRLAQVRTEADSKYFGLDLRMDFGDPTLGAVENAEATSIVAGLAMGRQFVGEDPLAPSLGVRFRGGVRYTDLRDLDETRFALDGGLALVAKRPVTMEQVLTISGGFEFRAGGVEEDLEGALQSDFLTFKAAMSVPVTTQTAITISFAQPLVGERVSQKLAVTADWRLLLAGLDAL